MSGVCPDLALRAGDDGDDAADQVGDEVVAPGLRARRVVHGQVLGHVPFDAAVEATGCRPA